MDTMQEILEAIVSQAEDFINVYNSGLPEGQILNLLIDNPHAFSQLHTAVGVSKEGLEEDLEGFYTEILESLPKYKELLAVHEEENK